MTGGQVEKQTDKFADTVTLTLLFLGRPLLCSGTSSAANTPQVQGLRGDLQVLYPVARLCLEWK